MVTVSVILPSYNRRGFLEAAVASVFAQTYTDWELIIADDGSAEDARAFLRSLGPPARVLWLEHCGNPGRVRNAAMHAARGRYLAFLDSDDVFFPEKLAKQVRALDASPCARWSYTLEALIDAEGQDRPRGALPRFAPRAGWVFEPLLRVELSVPMLAVMARRDLLDEIGGFDERLRFGEWHDLCLRMALRSEVLVVPEVLCAIRLHGEHYTADRIAEQRGWLQLYRQMADIAPSGRLRAECLRICSQTSLQLAHTESARGEFSGALGTLWHALPYSWASLSWWRGVARQLLKPLVPARLRAVLRRSRLPP